MSKLHKVIFFFTMLLSSTFSYGQITEIGLASFYADKFDGRITASGEIFDQKKMTAAHRTFPFGTKVKVSSFETNKSVIVTINDRGPFVNDRVIDLSRAAATELGFVKKGVTKVKVEVISMGKSNSSATTASPKKNKTSAKASTTTSVATKTSTPALNKSEVSYYAVDSEILTPEGFGIQIASFQEAANLMQRVYEVKQQTDKKVIIQVGESNGNQVYRMILGSFKTREEALAYQQKAASKYPGCFLVVLK